MCGSDDGGGGGVCVCVYVTHRIFLIFVRLRCPFSSKLSHYASILHTANTQTHTHMCVCVCVCVCIGGG